MVVNKVSTIQTIVITHPEFITNEDKALSALFENGLETLHVRKPNSTLTEMTKFLEHIPINCLEKIVLHDHFELSNIFPVKGLHINSRNNEIPVNFSGQISTSCHSIEEVILKKNKFHYVFLSPIFDSISKQGYQSAFNIECLEKASSEKIINDKVIALGGITPDKISYLIKWEFGGYALLGYLWDSFIHDFDISMLTQRFLNCQTRNS